VTRTVFPGFNTSLPGSFTSSVATWVVGTPAYVPSTNTLWFPQRAVAVPGDPTPTIAPVAVFNLTSGGFDRLLTDVSNASALAYDQGNGDVYATVPSTNSVLVVDPRTGTLTGPAIPVGTTPSALAFDPNSNQLFVANSGSSNVTVIDTLVDKVQTKSVAVGTDPVALVADPQDGLVFVANAGSKFVTAINTSHPSTLSVNITLTDGPAAGLAFSPSSDVVLATIPSSTYVTFIDASAEIPLDALISIGRNFVPAAASTNGTEFVIGDSAGGQIAVLNATTGVAVDGNIPVERNATELVVDQQTGFVYCWTSLSGVLEKVDLSVNTAAPITTTDFAQASSLSFVPGSSAVYAGATNGSTVYSLDPAALVQRSPIITTAAAPLSIAADPVGARFFVGTTGGLAVYSASSGQLTDTVSGLTGNCSRLVLDRGDHLLWLSNSLLGVVGVNLTTLRVVISTGISIPPSVAQGIAVDTTDSEVFVLVSTTAIGVLDSHTGGVITSGITVGSNVTSLVFDPTDNQVYAAGDEVSLVSGTTLKVDGGVDPFSGSHGVLGAAYDPSREAVYVSSIGSLPGRQGTITVIDGSSVTSSENSTVEVPVGEDPTSLAVVSTSGTSPGLSMVWVANELSGTISVLSTPPEITNFAATPSPVDLGRTTSIVATFEGGAGGVTVSYSGLPPGCSSTDELEWNCTPIAPGVYRLGVNLTDSLGVSTNATTSLTVLQALVVRATFEPATLPEIDVGIPFQGSASVSNGLAPYSIKWSFGDGSSATGPDASHAYDAVGAYAVVVQAFDATGASSNASAAVIVVPPPSVSVSLDPGNATDVDFPVAFVPLVVGGTGAASVHWLFGDGTEATVANATHAWTRSGTYAVTFQYVDRLGMTANWSANVTVRPSLAATFSSGNVSAASPAAPGTPVEFSATVSGGTSPYLVSWAFGDRSMATGLSVYHSYGAAGTYTVEVNLTDAVGATVHTNLTVSVSSPSSSGGGITSLGGGFATGLFVGLIVGGVLAAVVLFVAGSRQGERSPPTPGPPYVPP
jgi:YVTN family beta-propeller protein